MSTATTEITPELVHELMNEIDQLKLRIVTYHDKHRELQGKYLDVCSKLNRIASVLKGDAK
jgi:chaperonin cofactor prefoldin